MHEPSAFEIRPVLAPRRARRNRLAVLLPLIALAGIAVVGLTGTRSNPTTADLPAATQLESTSPSSPTASEAPYPTQALGLTVHRLDDVQLARLNRGDVVAIEGWYLPLATTNCPAGVPSQQSPPPRILPGFDPWAYCERSGVLYAVSPGPDGQLVAPSATDHEGTGPEAVSASLLHGVRLPASLEAVHPRAMEVVVLGHFVETSSACMLLGACPSELVVDYLAWAPDGPTS